MRISDWSSDVCSSDLVLGLRIPQQAEALKRRIGYMTQRFSLFEDLKVRENLEFLAAVQGLRKPAAAARVDELLHAYHLHDRAEQMAGTLSGGQRQRLALAVAVIHTPALGSASGTERGVYNV